MARRGSRSRAASKADQEFVSEAEELLERMRAGLADLSDQRAGGGEVDPQVVNGLFRAAHSLKALAGLFGFEPVRDLAHRLEDLLDSLRLARVALDERMVALVEDAVCLFASLLERVGDTEVLAASGESIAELAERIASAARPATADPVELDALGLEPSLLRALTEYEEHRLRENVRRGRGIALVDSTFELNSFEEGLSELTAAVRSVAELLSTLPAPGATPESEIRFSLLAATGLAPEELAARLDAPQASVRWLLEPRALQPERAAPTDAVRAATRETAAGDAAPTDSGSLKSISNTVRVNIRKLDELMNLVGELVNRRGSLGKLIGELLAEPATARIGGEFSRVHKDLDRKLRELQAAVLDVRMVPLRQVFEKISRVVRRLRRELGKDVRLELRGAETELDKLIVEELVDPLMHIVRNALDHAIEPREERVAAGKDPEGTVVIEAFQRGNHVVIAVSDDGAGIDTEALRAQAEARGLVAPDEGLSDKELLDLIFEPGMSTRSEVSRTSGRGVGMDVVRTNLTLLGGVVDVESISGGGTKIALTLPITLAIVQSLVVGVADQRFAIPVNAVLETLLVDREEIQRSEGRELLNLRGEALLLRRLAEEFGLPAAPAEAKPHVVVAGIGDQRIGLLVDRLEGQQDAVIKAIQGPVPAVRGIAGATELGDRDPVLVLDVSALVEDAVRRRDAA